VLRVKARFFFKDRGEHGILGRLKFSENLEQLDRADGIQDCFWGLGVIKDEFVKDQ
jgi:hypothetical protein